MASAAAAVPSTFEAPWAGFWIRVAAYVIDAIVSGLIAIIPALAAAALFGYSSGSTAAAETGFSIGFCSAQVAYFWIAMAKGGGTRWRADSIDVTVMRRSLEACAIACRTRSRLPMLSRVGQTLS